MGPCCLSPARGPGSPPFTQPLRALGSPRLPWPCAGHSNLLLSPAPSCGSGSLLWGRPGGGRRVALTGQCTDQARPWEPLAGPRQALEPRPWGHPELAAPGPGALSGLEADGHPACPAALARPLWHFLGLEDVGPPRSPLTTWWRPGGGGAFCSS